VKLEPIDAIRPSSYNPRKADPKRLELVGLSLRKLGFVLPIVADEEGEIISGHQRHHVAGLLGMTHVPVARIAASDEATRKGLNIVFNRGTNDMTVTDHSKGITLSLAAAGVQEAAAGIADAEDPYRCLRAEQANVNDLAPAARPRYDSHMRNMARALYSRAKFKMPIVATREGHVVNGVGRVQYAMESGIERWPVVWISEAEAEFAAAMLNLLSMDFNIHEKYADLLRHNSFRRLRTKRDYLGHGFTCALPINVKTVDEFDIADPKSAALWKRTYGRTIVDFGAGHLHETEMLRRAGVTVTPFEPYRCGEGNEIDKTESLRINRAFLADIASGRQFDSVFLSSVLNSVPFVDDRRHIIRLCAALCGERTMFYTNAMSVSHENFTSVILGAPFSERRQSQAGFTLDYEDGITLGDFMDKPKVQKYHTGSELYDLVKCGFEMVEVKSKQDFLTARAAKAKAVDPVALRAAIEFEFDLPYPDGSKMALVGEALEAYGKRLGMKL
jgi:hypothetical protein